MNTIDSKFTDKHEKTSNIIAMFKMIWIRISWKFTQSFI